MLQNTDVLLHITKYNDFITKCDNYYKMRRLLQIWPSFPKTILPPLLFLSRLKDGNSLIAFYFELIFRNDLKMLLGHFSGTQYLMIDLNASVNFFFKWLESESHIFDPN